MPHSTTAESMAGNQFAARVLDPTGPASSLGSRGWTPERAALGKWAVAGCA
jgi:hypothetical protein